MACANEPQTKQKKNTKSYIEPNQLIVVDSMRLTGPNINNFYYKVAIYTTEFSNEDQYLIKAAFGHNIGQTETILPDLNQELRLAIRKNNDTPYSYIIGFYMEEDDFKIFHDYMEATAKSDEIKFKYLKSYYLD